MEFGRIASVEQKLMERFGPGERRHAFYIEINLGAEGLPRPLAEYAEEIGSIHVLAKDEAGAVDQEEVARAVGLVEQRPSRRGVSRWPARSSPSIGSIFGSSKRVPWIVSRTAYNSRSFSARLPRVLPNRRPASAPTRGSRGTSPWRRSPRCFNGLAVKS